MIIVTGGAGFIGSNLIKGLNAAGSSDILVVDDLSNGKKFANLVDCEIQDYQDTEEFWPQLKSGALLPRKISRIFHLGACTTTTEWDGRYLMHNNYAWSRDLLELAVAKRIPFIYASSAAVYGTGTQFIEQRQNEKPISAYGYSKSLFDQYARRHSREVYSHSQIAGLRYFNVYGPGEQHKGAMASMAWKLNAQLQESDKLELFQGSGGHADGEQRRDFIHVDDVVAVNLWLMEHKEVSGVFNLGTGTSRSFNELAGQVIAWHGRGEIEYIPLPDGLEESYQSFTQADMSALREAGYEKDFISLEDGMKRYLDWLNSE